MFFSIAAAMVTGARGRYSCLEPMRGGVLRRVRAYATVPIRRS